MADHVLSALRSSSTRLTHAAGEMALQAGHLEQALELFDAATQAYRAEDELREAARVAGPAARALSRLGRNEEAIARVRPALRTLGEREMDADVGTLQAVLGNALLFAGHFEEAQEPLEIASRIARELELPSVLCGALMDKGLICLQNCQPEEARALLGAASEIAERHELVAELLLARGNSGSLGMQWDLPEAADQYAEALTLARRQGDRFQESVAAGNLAYLYVFAGRWQEVESLAAKLLGDLDGRPGAEFIYSPLAIMQTLQGDLPGAEASLERMHAWRDGDDDELRAIHASVLLRVDLCRGQADEALASGKHMLGPAIAALGTSHDAIRNAWPDTLEAALALGLHPQARALLALLSEQPPGHVPPPSPARRTRRTRPSPS